MVVQVVPGAGGDPLVWFLLEGSGPVWTFGLIEFTHQTLDLNVVASFRNNLDIFLMFWPLEHLKSG